jgi:hypothetical protein
MDSGLTPKQKSAIERAKRNPDLLRVLFNKASGVQWFRAFAESGFLDPSAIPSPVKAEKEGYVNIPHWPVTDYLVATSPELADAKNREYAVAFLDFIRAATTHAQQKHSSNYRVWWQFSKVLRYVPPTLITTADVDLIDYWLSDPYETGLTADTVSDLLGELLNQADPHSKDLGLALFKVLFKVRYQDSENDTAKKKATLRFSPWHAKKIITKVASQVGRSLGPQSVDLLRETMEEILSQTDSDRWSHIWRPAIEDHEQNKSDDDTDDIILEALRDSLLGYVDKVQNSADEYLSSLLASKFDTSGRVAIYVIDKKFEYCAALVSRVIDKRRFKDTFRHELWHFLRNHYPWFPEPAKRNVQEIINAISEKDESGQEYPRRTVYHRAIWLSAIASFDEKLASEYSNYLSILKNPLEHPDFASFMSSGWVSVESPITVDQLVTLDVPALITTLENYREPSDFREPGMEGLAKALREVVKREPLRIQRELQRFVAVDLAYVHEIVEAYAELADTKAELPWAELWDRLLRFCEELTASPSFWAAAKLPEKRSLVATHEWVSVAIARLIESGVKNDGESLPESLIGKAAGVLRVLLQREEARKFPANSDAVSLAINSSRGRCLEALIKLTRFACHLEHSRISRHDESWDVFEPYFDEELIRVDRGECEFVTIAGTHLPLFVSLSHEWTLGNFRRIFNQERDLQWRCAMQGYSYAGVVHPDIYNELKRGGDFLRALDDETLAKRTEERFVQNIAIAYVYDFESIAQPDSLMIRLIERRKSSELNRLVWFLWTLRNDANEKLRGKIFELWPLLNRVIDINTKQGRQLASRLCDWIAFIQRVDDESRALILYVAPYADEDHNSYDVLIQIARLSEHQPLEAYEIWTEVLKGSRADYPDEAIRDALRNLVRSGADGKRNAKQIASHYLRAGNETPNKELQKILAQN